MIPERGGDQRRAHRVESEVRVLLLTLKPDTFPPTRVAIERDECVCGAADGR
jgi:hypothetical protein